MIGSSPVPAARPGAAPAGLRDVTARRRTHQLVVSMRPEQWTENLFVFAALLFGGRLVDPIAVFQVSAAFAIFCAVSASAFLLDDVADREADRQHPLMGRRPISSGELPVPAAIAAASVLGGVSLLAAFAVRPALALVTASYLSLLILYSTRLKHIVIIDALTIATAFVLRTLAGAVVVAVPISSWLLVCTTLLALFLALSKRRHELTLHGDTATGQRRTLQEYSPHLLDQMISVVTPSTLIAYSVYATSAETAARLGTTRLGLTIPFVLYGILRYLYLVHQKRRGGSPAALLLTDRPLLVCVALWALSVVVLLYQ